MINMISTDRHGLGWEFHSGTGLRLKNTFPNVRAEPAEFSSVWHSETIDQKEVPECIESHK